MWWVAPCDDDAMPAKSGRGDGVHRLQDWRRLRPLVVACKGSAMKMNDHYSDERLRTGLDGTEMVHCCDSCGEVHSHGVAKGCYDRQACQKFDRQMVASDCCAIAVAIVTLLRQK